MQQIEISKLREHPKNSYFFDDMTGDGWDSMIQSISTSGVTNAITITDDNVIISGHQRVRACKVLGIDEIECKVISYSAEEYERQKDVKDLIESNLRQRVVGNANPIKLGRCFQFLNDWYEFERGGNHGNQYTVANGKVCRLPEGNEPQNQDELADTYGIARTTMNNYMRLAKAIPELEELVQTGIASKDTALAIMRQLSEEEQIQLISSIPAGEKLTKRKADQYISQLNSAKAEAERLRNENNRLRNQPQKIQTIEVMPDDY